jgi:hypothetical protein
MHKLPLLPINSTSVKATLYLGACLYNLMIPALVIKGKECLV